MDNQATEGSFCFWWLIVVDISTKVREDLTNTHGIAVDIKREVRVLPVVLSIKFAVLHISLDQIVVIQVIWVKHILR